MRPLLSVRSLRYGYGGPDVLRGVDFELERGESCVLLGPNGVGKSTLLALLAGLARPLGGSIWLDGTRLDGRNPAGRQKIGFLSHASFSYPTLTAEENLLFSAQLFGVDDPRSRVRELLTRVSLQSQAGRPVRTFSRGMSQRLSLARSILHHPRLLLLDEPMNGLDPEGVSRLTDLTQELREDGTAILAATHDLSHLADLGDRLAWLRRGKWEDVTGLDLRDMGAVEDAYLRRFSSRPSRSASGAAADPTSPGRSDDLPGGPEV